MTGSNALGVGVVPRPSLRGSLHRWSVPVAAVLTVLVAVRAPAAGSRAGVIVYGTCVTAMLAVSGLYHAPQLAQLPRRLLRRLDHSMILVGIAGTYTAIIVMGLTGTTRAVLLVVAWATAALGVAIRMLWMDAPPWLVSSVYLVAGWMVLLDLPAYASALASAELVLLALGGLAYTLGAVVYARRRPNPWPTVFGYHEVFHALVIVGALAHWLCVFLLAGRLAGR